MSQCPGNINIHKDAIGDVITDGKRHQGQGTLPLRKW